MNPRHGVSRPQSTASPYTITVNAASYIKGSNLTVTIQGGEFKGYILQARPANESVTQWPVGTFISKAEGSQYLYCSGGSLQNTITHENTMINGRTNRTFTWEAPASVSYGDIKFWATVVKDYTTFWTNINSSIISGPAADFPDLSPGSSFDFNTTNCGKTKGCFFLPENCNNSNNCDYLLTYQKTGENLTIEMSANNSWVSVGFNSKQKMDGMDSIMCSTLENKQVEQRHQLSIDHNPVRKDLAGTNDQFLDASVYENGFVKCRVTRKMSSTTGTMQDLTKELHLLFAHGTTSPTGVANYHNGKRYVTRKVVDVSKPQVLDLSGGGSSSNEITKTECDKTKSCLSHPKSCKSSSDCDYLVTYKATGDEVEFELASKDNWAAIGFNDEAEMPDTDALICMTANNKVTVEHYVANNGKGAPSKTQPTPNSIVVSLEAQESGKVRCRFKRKKEADNMKDLKRKWYLIFAYGSVGGSDINYHAWRSTSKEKLDVSKVQAISSSSDNARLIQAHGALMIIAWAGFATIGIFMARYMKLVWSDQTLLGQKVWFTIHRLLMTCAVLFTIIAIILIFVHVKDWSSDAGAHPYVGIIVSVLAVIQPIMAFFRPHPGTPKRWIFTWAHRGVGLVALFGAVVTIFLGVLLPHLDLDNKGVYVMIFYCVAIIVALILEIYIATRKPEGGIASYSLPGKEGEEVNMKAAPPSISDQDVKLRKFIFGFLVVVVIVAILALVILIAMAADDD